MSGHACNARGIVCAQRNGNDNTSIVTLLWKNGSFLKFPTSCFSFCEDKFKPKEIRLSFSEKFLEPPPKNVSETGVNLGSEVEHPQHGYEVRRDCYRFSCLY